MSGSQEREQGFVPISFEDLRRDTRPDRPALPLAHDRQGPDDVYDLVSQGDFMRRSGLIAGGAAALGALLILAAYARPILQTFDAFHTAGQVAASKAGQQLQGVQQAGQGLADKAAFVKTTDEKAINTAKGGLACLTGQAACANGSSSPFR